MKIVLSIILLLFGVLSGSVNGDGSDFNIDVKQKDAESYHEQSNSNNEFNYGYQVEKVNSQFQHKVKGPDDVTYGCYGYIDPDNEKHLVYYVADRMGYRVVAPNQPTKIFTDRVSNSINKLNNDLSGRNLDPKVVAWNDLYLPDSCRKLNEILTITKPPINIGANFNSANGNFDAENSAFVDVIATTSAPRVITSTFAPSTSSVPTSTFAPPTASVPAYTFAPRIPSSTQGVNTTSVRYATIPNLPPVITTAAATTTSFLTNRVTPRSTASTFRTTFSTPNPNGFGYTEPRIQKTDCDHKTIQNPPQQVPNLGPFNGYVYPIHGDCGASAYNVKQLLAQMEALNAQVLELTANISTLQQASLTGESTCCKSWLDRQQFPLLVYVPIILPYIDNSVPSNVSPNSASDAFRRMCEACK
ncbi:uncharacterized protein LOC129726038 [Wyeomyia smithii]|uniref:uncharacterized protein LOC129726038 n=1 Tax=Wyeomyia smithii TaxID=174621 RepID=UPI002467F4F3|nr:uncharacterized protein LOC129726038 [Wyeomyia smithii]